VTSSTLRAAENSEVAPTTPPKRSLGSLVGRGAIWAVAANPTMRFASIAITAVLAGLLSKEDFGVFAVALAVFFVVSSLAELGMGSAVAFSPMQPDDVLGLIR
jgi:PST family polysaccharide transporter